MTELTVAEVLQRIDGDATPTKAFADSLLTSLLQELEGTVVEPEVSPERVPRIQRWRPATQRPSRHGWPWWARVAAATVAVMVLLVVLQVVPIRPQSQDALAVMREAQAAFKNVPPFEATVMKRMPGAWLEEDAPSLQRPVPDLVVERNIAYLDPTHFRNVATKVTWDVNGPVSTIDEFTVEQGSYWAADGQYFASYSPTEGTYTVEPIGDPRDLAFFAAGELMPKIEWMSDPGGAYMNHHCEVLPDETMFDRRVKRIHCTDPDFRQYPGGPTLDLDTWVDAETGMLFRMESRNEGLWFAVRSIDFAPDLSAEDFRLQVPEGAAMQWQGDGAPPEQFRTDVDDSVTSIQVGNNPEGVAYGAGSVWVTYTQGGTGGDGEGGKQAVARIDPSTNEVIARIVAPTGLTEIPKGWVSPLVFVTEVLPTDEAVYIAYYEPGNDDEPVHIAAIDTATNELGPPILTLDRVTNGYYGAFMAYVDGALWVCDTQGGDTFPQIGQHSWPLGALLKVDPATGEKISRFPIEGNCGDMLAVDGSFWFRGIVPAKNGDLNPELFEVDMATGATSTFPIAIGSTDIALGDGEIWIVDQQLKALNRFDIESGQLGEPIETGIPTGFGDSSVAWGEGVLWETNSSDNSLVAIDPATGAVTETIAVGAYPLDVLIAEGSVWVANYRDGTVARVQE